MKEFIVPRSDTRRHSRMSNTEFRRAMEVLDASLDDMAERLGIARRLVAHYRKDADIPATIALSVRYLLLLAAAPKTAERLPRLIEWEGVIDR